MMSEQSRLFQHLVRNPAQSPIGFETWLVGAAQLALDVDAIEAERLAVRRKAWIWTAFAKYDQELRARGCVGVFRVLDEVNRVFWSPGPEDGSARSRRFIHSDRHRVVGWIDALTDRKFEYLGAAVCFLLGASRWEVTPGGGDGGVDFYALLPSWGSSGVFHSPHKALRIVGQSKYYKDTVGTDEAKLLVKTVEDIRSLTVEMAGLLPDWFKASRGPVVGVMVAPLGFQSGATDRAHNHGVMLADSIDVAETIVSSRKYKSRRVAGAEVAQILDEAMTTVGWSS